MYKHLVLTETEHGYEGVLHIDGAPRYVFQEKSFIHANYHQGVDKETQKQLIIELANEYPWDRQKKHELGCIEINKIPR